jgi:hypothetical protein
MNTKENAESKPHENAESKMKTVKAAWDKEPAGAKKDASFKHYSAAEKAHKAKNDRECMTELAAAEKALN